MMPVVRAELERRDQRSVVALDEVREHHAVSTADNYRAAVPFNAPRLACMAPSAPCRAIPTLGADASTNRGPLALSNRSESTLTGTRN